MSAISTMKREIKKMQRAQDECINEHGIIRSGYRYRYTMLTRKIKSFKDSIEWLQAHTECS